MGMASTKKRKKRSGWYHLRELHQQFVGDVLHRRQIEGDPGSRSRGFTESPSRVAKVFQQNMGGQTTKKESLKVCGLVLFLFSLV